MDYIIIGILLLAWGFTAGYIFALSEKRKPTAWKVIVHNGQIGVRELR